MATGTLSNRGFPHFGLVWLWDPETAACPDTGGDEDCGVRVAERGTTSATAADPSHTLDRLAESRPRITLAASRVRPPGSWLRVVERRRLLDRVSRAVADAPFTLISAPAGYGKTVLASEWAGSRASHLRPAAWLTVSDRDNQPGVFWCHVLFALTFVGASQQMRRFRWLAPHPPSMNLVSSCSGPEAWPFSFSIGSGPNRQHRLTASIALMPGMGRGCDMHPEVWPTSAGFHER
jgi:hypothetical protein